MRRFALPANQPRRLNPPDRQRDARLFDQNRNQDFTAHPLFSFSDHPIGFGGIFRPHDNHTSRIVQRLLNHLMPSLSRRNPAIPPNRPALLFERLDERCDALAILTGITKEDVCHSLPKRLISIFTRSLRTESAGAPSDL